VSLLSANLILCETILVEPKSEKLSAVNVIDTFTLLAGEKIAHFYSLTLVYGYAGDVADHTLSVRIAKFNGDIVSRAPDYHFKYARRLNTDAPGGLHLHTEFRIDVTQLGELERSYVVWAFLDEVAVAKAPLMLRRS
jgi:hypothetical protein